MPEEKLDLGILARAANKPAEANPIMAAESSKFDPGSGFSIDPTPEYWTKNLDYLNEARAQNQSTANRWGLAALRVTNKIGVELASVPGYLAGAAEAAFTDKSIGEALDNHYLNTIKEYENTVNEDILKVYVPDAVKNGGLAANLGSASFWATEGADGVGFLVSMLLPGNALKLAKLGNLAAETGNLALKGYKYLKPASTATKFGTRAAENFDNFTAALVNSTIESAAEAKEAFDSSLLEMQNSFMEENGLSDPSQIPQDVMQDFRMRAGEASSSVFKWNSALLLGPNMMDQANLFGAFGSRKGLFASMFDDAGKLGTYTARETKDKLLNYALGVGKGFAKEGLFEEGSQFAISEYFKEQAAGNYKDKRVNEDFVGIVKTYIDNLDNVDMQKSIVLGGILGGPMSLYGTYKEEQYNSKYGKELNEQLQNGLLDRYKGVFEAIQRDANGNIQYQTDPTTGKQVPKLNIEKAFELFQQPENKMLLNNLRDVAMLEGNKEDHDLFQSILDFNYFQNFFQHGKEGLDILKRHIQGELASKEMDKQVLEEMFNVTGSKTQSERVADLLTKADEYYKIYDDITNRHSFDMPSLQGGTKDQQDTFSKMMISKKLEKNIFQDKTSEIVAKLASRKTELLYKTALYRIKPEDLKTEEDTKLNESDKKQLEFIEKKEKQYKDLLEKINNDTKALYDKPSIQEAYEKWLKESQTKAEEDEAANEPDDDVVLNFSKQLTDAGYVMDTEHILDPDKKAKLTPEQLEKYKGNDTSFYFELNGKEYEAFSYVDPKTKLVKRIYRDSETKQTVGNFNIEFLKKNKNIRIINKQEATDKRKLEKLRKNKIAKLRAFDVIYNSMLNSLSQNKNALEGLYSKRIALKEEIELYKNWIKDISNEFGRANNGKAQEKKDLQAEIKRVEKLIADIDLEIADNNQLYESLERQYNLLLAIKEDFEIYKEDGIFKTELPGIAFNEFSARIKEQINQELEQLIQEEQDVNQMLETAQQAVDKAQESLNEALDLRTELEIIFEDLTRVRDINDIIRLLMSADFREDAEPRYNENGRLIPSALTLLANKYKPLRLIYEAVEKLRDNTITDEEYIKLIGIANNLLTDTYLGFGFQGLTEIKNEITKAVNQSKRYPLNAQIEFKLNKFNFVPDRIIGNLVEGRTRLLDAANKLLAQVTDDRKAISDKAEPTAKQLGQRESELTSLINDLFVQYKRFLNIGNVRNVSFNNESPIDQSPTVYDNPEGRINPDSFLANFIFRSIGLDILYDEQTGKTTYVNGLPQLNEKDENFRRLQKFIEENPDLASKYNVRFFIARTDAEGNTSVNLGADQTNSEILGLYNGIGMPNNDLSIGFYLEDKEGKFATQNYKGSDKMVIGWIPQSITDANGRLRVNNATAVSIVTGFDIKGRVKMINEYNVSKKDNTYVFAGTNNKRESNVTVEIVDGKAVVNARFDILTTEQSPLTIPDDKAQEIAYLLNKNTAYSLSRAGKEIYTLLKQSKVKYHNYIELEKTKTNFVEDDYINDTYGEVTIKELIDISKTALAGNKGLYQTSVINKLVEHVETNNKKAYVGILQVTGGVPLIQYETDPSKDSSENTLFQKPIQSKVTKAFPLKIEKGVLKGGSVEIVDFTNTVRLGYQPGTVVLRLKNDRGNYTNEVVKLDQRTLNTNEILTALFIMSTADQPNLQSPDFGKLPDGKKKFMRTSKAPKGFTKYGMLPFNSKSNVSAITSLIYWGKHNEDFYTDAQGNKVPMTTNKVGEIFYHEGQIYFKRKTQDGTWIDTSTNINTIREALLSANPLQDSRISDLVSFLADKRLNVNKELLSEDAGGLYFHPTVTKTAEGYQFGFQSFDSYQDFLLSGSGKYKEALTTSVPVKENFPKFANKMIVFKSTGRIAPFIKEEFVEPKEEAPAPSKRKAATKAKAIPAAKTTTSAAGSDLSAKFAEKQKSKKQSGQKFKLKIGVLKDLKNTVESTEDLIPIIQEIFKQIDPNKYENWRKEIVEEDDDIKEGLASVITSDMNSQQVINTTMKYLLPIYIDMEIAKTEKELNEFLKKKSEEQPKSQEEETADEIATGTGGLMKGGKIEFKKKKSAPVSNETKTPIEGLNERLDNYGNARVVLSDDFNEGARPKGRLNAFKSDIITIADNLIALADVNLNEFNFLTEEDKKRLDALRPLARELNKINTNDISSADRRTVAVEKRYAELTNQLANEFVDIIGKHVEQQLGKSITSSKPKLTILEGIEPTIDARTIAESKVLEILNRYAEPSDNIVEYQGDEIEGPTEEDFETGDTSTLGKIINAFKSFPPVSYNFTSKSIEEFKQKVKDELEELGLEDMIDDIISNIDKLVDEQLNTLQSTTTKKSTVTQEDIESFGQASVNSKTGKVLASFARNSPKYGPSRGLVFEEDGVLYWDEVNKTTPLSQEETSLFENYFKVVKFLDEKINNFIKDVASKNNISEQEAFQELITSFAKDINNFDKLLDYGFTTDEIKMMKSIGNLHGQDGYISSLHDALWSSYSYALQFKNQKVKDKLASTKGDTYQEQFELNPFYKIIKDAEKQIVKTSEPTPTTTSANPFGKKKTGLGVGSNASTNNMINKQNKDC